MAAQRKLQTEINQTLKKVDEGLKDFENQWSKMQSSTDPNQRERYEGELKKELKKLQRFRDTIRQWLQLKDCTEIPRLTDYRQRIEGEMERFKEMERIFKMKTFSTEGLRLAPELIDPEERERQKHKIWLQACIEFAMEEKLKSEVQIEELTTKKKKTSADTTRLTFQKEREQCFAKQIANLEMILRKLMNLEIDAFDERLEALKSDLEAEQDYHRESQEDANENNDGILNADNSVLPDTESLFVTFEDILDPNIVVAFVQNCLRVSGDSSSSVPSLRNSASHDNTGQQTISANIVFPGGTGTQSNSSLSNVDYVGNYFAHSISNQDSTSTSFIQSSTAALALAAITMPSITTAAAMSAQPAPSANNNTEAQLDFRNEEEKTFAEVGESTTRASSSVFLKQQQSNPSNSQLQDLLENTQISHTNNNNENVTVVSTSKSPSSPSYNSSNNNNKTLENNAEAGCETNDRSNHKNIKFSVVENGTALIVSNNDLFSSLSSQFQQFESTDACMKLKPILPLRPLVNLDLLFPREVIPELAPEVRTLEFFEKLSLDTLFFVFYYCPGTRDQYYASSILKEKSWRFHTEEGAWFQRFEEPIETTEAYEIGSFLRVDGSRPSSFTVVHRFQFFYSFLEDERR